MGWEDAPIVGAAPKREAWESAPVVYQAQKRIASGIPDAIEAGYQGSLAGLVDRGRLPDIQLDPTNSKWYERLAAGASQLFHETPEMLAGSMAGGAVGSVAGPIGSLLGAGAGAFAIPAAIRESYIQAYSKGEIVDSADFLNRAAIVLKHTGKEALVGAATAGAGKLAGLGAEALNLGSKATAATVLGAEGATLVVTPALLEGRLPEPQDFMDAAILLVGLKGVGVASRKLQDIYTSTGKTPTEVLADAKADPTIIEDLKTEAPAVDVLSDKPATAAKSEPAYDPEARVSVQAFDAETGAMAETSMTAREALADNAKRREQMEGLRSCLGA